jgi:hypothetical protein
MKRIVTIISVAVLVTMSACETVKKCCAKDNGKTEKSEGVCSKCGNKSCTKNCKSKSDTLKIR